MPSSGVQTCARSEEHTSELQSHDNLVCRLLLEKKADVNNPVEVEGVDERDERRCLEWGGADSVTSSTRVAPSIAATRPLFWNYIFFFKPPAPPATHPSPLPALLAL